MLATPEKISKNTKYAIIVLMISIVLVFLIKYFSNSSKQNPIWKVYMRTAITYTITAILVSMNKYSEAGALMTMDSLMGLQSRHMAFIASTLMAQKK